jgi:hypothetical protein
VCAINFNGVEVLGCKFKLATLRQALGIEGSSPSGISPAGDADPHTIATQFEISYSSETSVGVGLLSPDAIEGVRLDT